MREARKQSIEMPATSVASVGAQGAQHRTPKIDEPQTISLVLPRSAPKGWRIGASWVSGLFALGLFVLAWQLVVWLGDYPAYILPTPAQVAARYWSAARDGTLATHTLVTLNEMLLGLLLGGGFGLALGYLLYKSHLAARLLSPYIAASQALPVVAIAPLLVLWFGFGLLPKVLICAIIVFFPITISTLTGLRLIERDLREVADLFGASAWQKLWLVEAPLAARSIFAGLRISVTLSATGAVVGEFISPSAGLGYLLNYSSANLDASLRFVALFTLVIIATLAYALVGFIERRVVTW